MRSGPRLRNTAATNTVHASTVRHGTFAHISTAQSGSRLDLQHPTSHALRHWVPDGRRGRHMTAPLGGLVGGPLCRVFTSSCWQLRIKMCTRHHFRKGLTCASIRLLYVLVLEEPTLFAWMMQKAWHAAPCISHAPLARRWKYFASAICELWLFRNLFCAILKLGSERWRLVGKPISISINRAAPQMRVLPHRDRRRPERLS